MNQNSMSRFALLSHNALVFLLSAGKAIEAEILANQREEAECLVGTFCKYNVLI